MLERDLTPEELTQLCEATGAGRHDMLQVHMAGRKAAMGALVAVHGGGIEKAPLVTIPAMLRVIWPRAAEAIRSKVAPMIGDKAGAYVDAMAAAMGIETAAKAKPKPKPKAEKKPKSRSESRRFRVQRDGDEN